MGNIEIADKIDHQRVTFGIIEMLGAGIIIGHARSTNIPVDVGIFVDLQKSANKITFLNPIANGDIKPRTLEFPISGLIGKRLKTISDRNSLIKANANIDDVNANIGGILAN